jgi:hypothetical protein
MSDPGSRKFRDSQSRKEAFAVAVRAAKKDFGTLEDDLPDDASSSYDGLSSALNQSQLNGAQRNAVYPPGQGPVPQSSTSYNSFPFANTSPSSLVGGNTRAVSSTSSDISQVAQQQEQRAPRALPNAIPSNLSADQPRQLVPFGPGIIVPQTHSRFSSSVFTPRYGADAQRWGFGDDRKLLVISASGVTNNAARIVQRPLPPPSVEFYHDLDQTPLEVDAISLLRGMSPAKQADFLRSCNSYLPACYQRLTKK